MDKKLHKQSIDSLLPDHDELNENYDYTEQRDATVQTAVDATEQKMNAATLARMKVREKRELEKLEKRKTDPTFGMTDKERAKYELDLQRQKENIAEIEVIEKSPEAQNFLAGGNSDLAPYSGATRHDVVKLLTSLNINLNINLTQTDTYNLLSCLLTANETQLNALFRNPMVPIAIKTVIKRLLDDCRLGNIDTVERLWDRIFGKSNNATLNMPVAGTQIPGVPGIIPHTIVSREAYTIIRDTIIGK